MKRLGMPIDYTLLKQPLPAHGVTYISGAMSFCKSEVSMTESDMNNGTMNALEEHLTQHGHTVLNPTTAASLMHFEGGLALPDPKAWELMMKKIFLILIANGVNKIVFLPPAHTVPSTPEKPILRPWHDSKGARWETVLGLMLGCSFFQATKTAEGAFTLAELSAKEVSAALGQMDVVTLLRIEQTGPTPLPIHDFPAPTPQADAVLN